METSNLNNIFQFIDFLHSKINDFNNLNDKFVELNNLKNEQYKSGNRKTQKEIITFNELQKQIENIGLPLQQQTIDIVKQKAIELQICDFENFPNYNYYNNSLNIAILLDTYKENGSIDNLNDTEIIKQYLLKYSKFKLEQYSNNWLFLEYFFKDLNETLQPLFECFLPDIDISVFNTKPLFTISLNNKAENKKQKETKSEKQEQSESKKKQTAKQYALVYFLDCEANDSRKYKKQSQAETEKTLHNLFPDKNGSTLRKALDEIKNEKEIFSINFLERFGGENWKETVLSLSRYPEQLKKLLKDKQL